MFNNRIGITNKFLKNTTRRYPKRKFTLVSEIHEFEELPTPRGLPIIGTTLSLIAAGSAPKLHEYVDKRHKQLGPIYKEKIGPVSAVFVSDPEYMRTVFANEGKYPRHVLPEPWIYYNQIYGCSRGLFFMDGEEWLHFRKIFNKHLLRGDRAWIDKACDTVSDKMVQHFMYQCVDNKLVIKDLEAQLYKWSIHVVVATLLGASTYEEAYMKIRLWIDLLATKVHLIFLTTSKLQLIPAKLALKLNLPQWRNFVDAVTSAVAKAKDLVENLLDWYPDNDGLFQRMLAEEVERKDIIRIVTDLVLAAGDTTAYSLEWMLYCIAKNQDVQNKLRNSCKEDRSVMLKNIMKETLRMYPVAPFLTRFMPEECIIGGYKIPADTLVILSIYTSGRDPKYFSNPEAFSPERWLRTDLSSPLVNRSLMQHASLPFAIGARSCIGRKIAETQLQMTVDKIVQNFRVTLCNERDVDITLKMVSVPSEPIYLKLVKLSR